MKKIAIGSVVLIFVGVLAVFGVIQLIPYGHDHTNPPVLQEPQWDSQQTRQLVQRACFDCHSNETVWPWYSNIAPVSWLVQQDVDEGRSRLNFSEWGRRRSEADDMVELIQEGEMPPGKYLLMHPSASLSAADQGALVKGLQATFGAVGQK
jgi:hypothetical protein